MLSRSDMERVVGVAVVFAFLVIFWRLGWLVRGGYRGDGDRVHRGFVKLGF